MAMDLAHGGHLTHGSPVTFSGKTYNFIPYGVNRETERIDYPELEKLAKKYQPRLIITGATAYPRVIDFERFRHTADSVGAKLMVDMAHIAGMVAAGVHPTPVYFADVVTSTTHKSLRGTSGGFILCRDELASVIDSAVFPHAQGKPLMHVVAAKAVTFHEAMKPDFADYQKKVIENAFTLSVALQQLGLRLVSGGTDNHLMLVDLSDKGITGARARLALEAAGVVTNKNSIPFDTRPPAITSGIRLGTPAVTTRGFGEEEMKTIAGLIVKVLDSPDDEAVTSSVKEEVACMCSAFPVPGIDD